MKIKITKPHKSILEPMEFELPDFTVLTGKNGSGKTHLFEAISDKENGLVTNNRQAISNITYIAYNQLNPIVDQQCGPNLISQRVNQIWNELNQVVQRFSRQKIAYSGIPENDPILLHISNVNYRRAILDISKRAGKVPSILTEDDISVYISGTDFSDANLFNSQFALIFKNYQIHHFDNMVYQMYEQKGIKGGKPYLSEEEFAQKFGPPPWDFVNGILKRLCLPYEVNNPMNTTRETSFIFKLRHSEKGFEINTNDLSTGEKTLMSLALAIYNTTGEGHRTGLLILDEPDAPLHPSMSNLMLQILQEDILKKQGIPVIISTHSPTTIACAPPDSLFKISAEDKIPKHCDYSDSIELLSCGIPNLRVSIESRRQVFVENQNDVFYYESLFNIVSRLHHFDTVPQFLPPHKQDGSNCDAVLNIVHSLRDMGNDLVYGLIDWDLHHTSEQQVIILGGGKRYAIENYIFEPHLVCLYLIHKNFITSAECGIADCHSYIDVIKRIETLPETINQLVNYIQGKLTFENQTPSKTVESVFISGYKIELPEEYFVTQGHALEEKYKDIWPKLKSIRPNNGGDCALKLDIIHSVINDMPQLLSVDIVGTFESFK